MSAQFCAPSWVTFDNGTIHLDLVELSAMELQLSFVSFLFLRPPSCRTVGSPNSATELRGMTNLIQSKKKKAMILYYGMEQEENEK